MFSITRSGLVTLSALFLCAATAACPSGDDGAGGMGALVATGGVTGAGGIAATGGMPVTGGMAATTGGAGGTTTSVGCGANTLKPGDPIKLQVSGDATFDGMLSQTVGAGCLFGTPTDKNASVSNNDATFKAQLIFNWNLDADPAYDGKSNADLIGKTLAYGTRADVPSLTARVSTMPGQPAFIGAGGSITIEELDATHVKGCLNGFSAWKTTANKSVTVVQPILFNCKH